MIVYVPWDLYVFQILVLCLVLGFQRDKKRTFTVYYNDLNSMTDCSLYLAEYIYFFCTVYFSLPL